jgi:hypothetical protein
MPRLGLRVRNDATATVSADPGVVRITGIRDYVDMHSALRLYLSEQRGFDVFGKATKIPRTTNGDVLALVPLWDRAAAKARTDILGVTGAIARWRETAAEVAKLTASADPAAVYANNVGFWRATERLAIRLQVANEEPPDVEFVDALVSNIKKLPGRVASVGDWFADAASGAAGAAGDALESGTSAVARGLTPLLKPIAIGAGVLGAGVLIVAAMNRRANRGR